jgi:protein-L-isoaspartate(D-aspartate) O-methyltransferase
LLAELGYTNVQVHAGSASGGWPESAPYERILVTAASPRIPVALLAQLSVGGRLVVPVGPRTEQQLLVLDKGPNGLREHSLGAVRFVPLVGQGGFPEEA